MSDKEIVDKLSTHLSRNADNDTFIKDAEGVLQLIKDGCLPGIKYEVDCHKRGDWWLTKEGREEIRETFDNYNDGNIVLPLLVALEKAEAEVERLQAETNYRRSEYENVIKLSKSLTADHNKQVEELKREVHKYSNELKSVHEFYKNDRDSLVKEVAVLKQKAHDNEVVAIRMDKTLERLAAKVDRAKTILAAITAVTANQGDCSRADECQRVANVGLRRLDD